MEELLVGSEWRFYPPRSRIQQVVGLLIVCFSRAVPPLMVILQRSDDLNERVRCLGCRSYCVRRLLRLSVTQAMLLASACPTPCISTE